MSAEQAFSSEEPGVLSQQMFRAGDEYFFFPSPTLFQAGSADVSQLPYGQEVMPPLSSMPLSAFQIAFASILGIESERAGRADCGCTSEIGVIFHQAGNRKRRPHVRHRLRQMVVRG